MWIVAVLDVTIVGVISALIAPFIAIILYLLPIYAIHKLPKLARYRTPINAFVFVMGAITIVGYFASTIF
jgi:serine transporter